MDDPAATDPAISRTSRCWTLRGDGAAVDVEVTAGERDLLGHVVPALARALGRPLTGIWAGSERLADDLLLAAPALRHGAVLGIDGPMNPDGRGQRSSALELQVVGGSDAGRSIPLDQGQHVLGRSGDATVRFDDPDVSRRHVCLQVGGGTISATDLGSTNGSRLDGDDLDHRPRIWPAGAILRLGGSAVTVAGPGAAPAALQPGPGGRFLLRPTPRMLAPAPEVEIVFPRAPGALPRRKLAWVAVALPAVGGVLMAWLLHTPTFLFFALLSPVVALATWISERWTGRRDTRRATADHAVEVLAAEKRVTAAVHADVRAMEADHPDLAALTTAARRRSHLLWSHGSGGLGALAVRVGSGPGATRVTRVSETGARVRVTAPHVPVTVDLSSGGGMAVVGPRERTVGVLSAVVAQLTALHAPGDVDLLLLVRADGLADWEWCRWLPHLAPGAVQLRVAGDGAVAAQQDDDLHVWLSGLTARRRAAAGTRPGDPYAIAAPGRLVVLVDRPLDARLAATLYAARDAGVLTVTTAQVVGDLPVVVDTTLLLSGETGGDAVLRRQGEPDRTDVVVDRLPLAVAGEFARDLAALAPTTSSTTLPRSVRLLELPAVGLRLDGSGTATGAWSTARDQLVATLGRTTQGTLEIDLCRQGPHALVAGTTGSGKSELLQTLIAGLALNHPPDRCSFLLVDYKGGAAFAEAAALPHTVGLVTDLDGQTTARALRSLAAELTRREAVLAAHQAADLADLPDSVELTRLVIVVDEFATLAEELPAFVPGLIAIAQRGRSLGIHLVLATQRPGGVVSPEIRANCTVRICLRTTDEADSRDVLGTTQAAHLPVDRPGRAYLRSGSGVPTAFQVARVATVREQPGTAGLEVTPWAWPFVSQPPGAAESPHGDTDLARIARAVAGHAEALGSPTPHRPWRPSLPDDVEAAALADLSGQASGGRRSSLPVGLVDRPERQSQEVLEVDLADGGTWLAVGGPRSGRTTLLRTVLAEAVHRFAPDDLHVHVVEAGGGALAAEAAALPHTGTAVGGEDALRTVRLVDRLAQEVAVRRAGSTDGPKPLLLLIIDGIETISTMLDESDPGRGSANLFRLLRDGAAAGLTCVITADRAVPGGRLAAVARQRLVLPLPDRADYAVAGVPARAVPAHRPPGRALLGEEALECQLALPRRYPPLPGPGPRRTPPLRIAELPDEPWLTVGHATSEPSATSGTLRLPIGPGGDEGAPVIVDLLRTGGLLVTGPPGSGRSTALAAFSRHLLAVGAAVLRLGDPLSDDAAITGATPGACWADPSDEVAVAGWVAALAGRPGVVVADDVGAPAEFPALTRLPAAGPRSGVVLLAAAGPGQLSSHYQGPVAALRRNRSGLLLCPGPGDADLLGVRLPRTPLPVRPGSGWLVTGPAMERVQVAQRRSSAGPISCVAYQASS